MYQTDVAGVNLFYLLQINLNCQFFKILELLYKLQQW
jgi:hypothetical protein